MDRYEADGVVVEDGGGVHAHMWEQAEKAARDLITNAAAANPNPASPSSVVVTGEPTKGGGGVLLKVPHALLVQVLRVVFGSLRIAKQGEHSNVSGVDT
jgi:hypothetical protein